MFDQIETIFKKQNVFSHKNQGITVANVKDSASGVDLVTSILYEIVDRKTVFYLSGGSTPKSLYEKLAREESILPGAVGQVDERFGPTLHQTSNQLMIRGTGFLRYLEIRDIPFYPILQNRTREETAQMYDEKIRELNAVFGKNVAVMGIGTDGHTSGIAPNRIGFTNPMFASAQKHLLVSEFDDQASTYKERVAMTFFGLEMQDLLLLLVFGEDKKEAMERMFEAGSEEDIPARFYKRPEIAKKTLLITDLQI